MPLEAWPLGGPLCVGGGEAFRHLVAGISNCKKNPKPDGKPEILIDIIKKKKKNLEESLET